MNHILLWFNSPIWIEFSVIPCDSLTERRNPLDRLDLGSSRRSFQPVGPSASSQNKILRSYAKRHPLWIGWLWQPSQLVGPLPQTWSKIALFLLISTFKQDDVRVAPFLGTLKQVQQGASQSYHIATTTTVNVYVQFFVVDVSPSHLPPAQQATARHLPGMLSFDWGISGASGDEQFGKLLPKLVTLYFHIWTVFGFCCIFCPYWDDFVGALPSQLPTESNPEMDEVHPVGSMEDVSCEEVGVQKIHWKWRNFVSNLCNKGVMMQNLRFDGHEQEETSFCKLPAATCIGQIDVVSKNDLQTGSKKSK